MQVSQSYEPDCMRRWELLKRERTELETLCTDLNWCEEQIKRFFAEKLYCASAALLWFEKWEEPEELKRQFCLEFLDAGKPLQYASERVAVTEHFILVASGSYLLERLYLATYFRNLEFSRRTGINGMYTYYFRDLTTFILEPEYTEDMALIKKTIQKFGLVVRPRILR